MLLLVYDYNHSPLHHFSPWQQFLGQATHEIPLLTSYAFYREYSHDCQPDELFQKVSHNVLCLPENKDDKLPRPNIKMNHAKGTCH